jgi:nicotinamide-nucleotide amidase
MSDFSSLAEQVGAALLQRRFMLATAESCTGGWVAQVITQVAGSSQWFERGFVTYSNASKQEMLGVTHLTLQQHGAVSEATVREMVAGALDRSQAQVALAISGIAGPGGGTADKPVGMVCFAWGIADGEVKAETHQFSGNRESVRRQSVQAALEGLMQLIK